MASGDWIVGALALGLFGIALACLTGVILLNWRRPTNRERRGFEVTPGAAGRASSGESTHV
jgi:hypothetical protein